jgi:pyridinium-3,5-bisthiocarboxylic acid mononucleotide nickel chelatase
MKTLYLQCNMGAAGDMLMAALLGLCDRPQRFVELMNNLGIPGVTLAYETAVTDGIRCGSVKVSVNGKEEKCEDVPAQNAGVYQHSGLVPGHHGHGVGQSEIKSLILSLPVSEHVKRNAVSVYDIIAQAEAKAHSRPVGEVHFHEVGSKDAVADVVGCCLLIELLSPDRILASPVNVGNGYVRCAHGILPVPAPATANILEGIPTFSNHLQGELCTPTGAALLKFLAEGFVPMPDFKNVKFGNGRGQKNYTPVNCVKACLGEENQLPEN